MSIYPRVGQLLQRPAGQPNLTVCDGYGTRARSRPHRACTDCPGEPFARRTWSVLLCAPLILVQPVPPLALVYPPLNVLLIGSDHNNHGLFAQVERVLNQLYLASSLGVVPYIYLGRKVHAAPDSCGIGENQYFDQATGPNVWEYFFEPVSTYRLGESTLRGRPVRLLLASAEDARRHAIYKARDAA